MGLCGPYGRAEHRGARMDRAGCLSAFRASGTAVFTGVLSLQKTAKCGLCITSVSRQYRGGSNIQLKLGRAAVKKAMLRPAGLFGSVKRLIRLL